MKLIILFVLIKVIPLLLMAFIAYEGALQLEKYVQQSTRYLFNQNKEIILNTANASIEDSIKNLDKKSQHALERLSFEIANTVAEFLYERDKDLLFLSNITLNQNILEAFYNNKQRNIILHDDYTYNEKTNRWETKKLPTKIIRNTKNAQLKDNEKEFNYNDPLVFKTQSIPIYKEISYFNLQGKEQYKVSQINHQKVDVSIKSNTYVNSETYFHKLQALKKGDIYVSDVIGEYVPSKVIGPFTKTKAKKLNIAFEPEKHAYAGKENPVGKKFEGIVRFITPVYKNSQKVGYISLALDHEHLMQFTDTSNPTSIDAKQDISNASNGNYAFMWDYEGKNISHPRDYFIAGFDKATGKRAMPWLSSDIATKFQNSNKEINEFLKNYPHFEEQSLKKRPNIPQLLKDGNVGLDCRYLNFAPQCQGWMQLTKNGGYGSFIIYWSKVWKLTTAAAIPYYTGKYATSKRGFGFVTIGANVDEFHAAANETKRNVTTILNKQTEHMKENVDENRFEIESFIKSLINELSAVTFLMLLIVIAIAIWVSNYISGKIEKLLLGTQKFANNEFDYTIKVDSKDEIGNLEHSFNTMAKKIKSLVNEQKELNEHLEEKVNEKTRELTKINQNLEEQINLRTQHLQETLKKAQQADEAKSIFLANMSHEIRTPLNAIIGFSDVLANNKELTTQTQKQASIIQNSANSLLTIINDILDISKIESGNFEVAFDKTDLYFISEQVIELFSKKAIEKHIKLVFNLDHKMPLGILSDGVRLRQVLSNLLSNAIKFTPEHGVVTLNITILSFQQNSATIRFEVIDTGIGIPKDKQESIFKPFMQVDHKSNREFEGTGLGLSISSHIIKAFNSKINLESSIGSGTKFWFDITFETTDTKLHSTKHYLNHVNFNVLDTQSKLYSYIKQYLTIFGTNNPDNSNPDILICSCEDKSMDVLQSLRVQYKDTPMLILFELEDEAKKFRLNLQPNEEILALPFFPSKLNDALQELLRKTDNIQHLPQEVIQQKFEGNILVAEDNSANQALIKYILENLGVNFDIKPNGQEAVNAYKKNQYDIILMDINMPVLDGVAAFNQIRAYENKQNIKQTPIIALTANAVKGDKEKFLNLGMNAYLSKPIKIDELKAVFHEFLSINDTLSPDIKESLEKADNPIKNTLDRDKIMATLGFDEEITSIIINNFKNEILQDLDDLETFIEEQNKDKIYQKAHYIKNTCLNLVLEEICALLKNLENQDLSQEEQTYLFKKIKLMIDASLKEQ